MIPCQHSSRAVAFQCEFCDIISHGRPNKSPAQLLAELDYLYELGWRCFHGG